MNNNWQSVGDWAEKQRVASSSPGVNKPWKMFWWVPGHFQSTVEVPLSKVPVPQTLTYDELRLIQECVRTSLVYASGTLKGQRNEERCSFP